MYDSRNSRTKEEEKKILVPQKLDFPSILTAGTYLRTRDAMPRSEADPADSSPELSPLDISQDLAPLPAYKEAGTTKIDLDGLLEPPLGLREDLSSGCGGQTWPAGMVLAKHMLRYHREDLAKERM